MGKRSSILSHGLLCKLLETQRNALLLFVDVEHLDRHFLAGGLSISLG